MSIFLINPYIYQVTDTPVEQIANAEAMSFNRTDTYVAINNNTILNSISDSVFPAPSYSFCLSK